MFNKTYIFLILMQTKDLQNEVPIKIKNYYSLTIYPKIYIYGSYVDTRNVNTIDNNTLNKPLNC